MFPYKDTTYFSIPQNYIVFLFRECCWAISANGLRANEGRETKALNCKPNTNLKEIFEPSN